MTGNIWENLVLIKSWHGNNADCLVLLKLLINFKKIFIGIYHDLIKSVNKRSINTQFLKKKSIGYVERYVVCIKKLLSKIFFIEE